MTNQTVFVTEANCFMSYKSNKSTVVSSDVSPVNGIGVFYGIYPDIRTTINYYPASAVYIPLNYCSGATFNQGYECPLFYYIPNTQHLLFSLAVLPTKFLVVLTLAQYSQIHYDY